MSVPHIGRQMRLAALAAAAFIAAVPARAHAQPLPDLVLNVTDTPDPVPATGLVTFGVAITNQGLGTATGVTYQMIVPANTRYQGFTAGTGRRARG